MQKLYGAVGGAPGGAPGGFPGGALGGFPGGGEDVPSMEEVDDLRMEIFVSPHTTILLVYWIFLVYL